ncbi:MAG: MBL fold metallo-hydrolase, partial [Chloroflexota bacterium]
GSALRAINAYLIKADDGWVLIDCGWNTDDVMDALQEAFRDVGIGLDDIRRLVITHYHTDHYGMAGTLMRLGKMRMLMHRIDWLHVRTRMADRETLDRDLYGWLELNGFDMSLLNDEHRQALDGFLRYSIVEPDEELEDGMSINLGDRDLKVIWTAGHTAGHICLFDAQRRALVAGDHVLDPISPSVGLSRPEQGNPLGDFLASLHKVSRLEADLVMPAHGRPFQGLQRRVAELLEHHEHREQTMLDALSDGPLTGAQVAAKSPWTRREVHLSELPPFQQRMAVTETLAHLAEMQARGKVSSHQANGRIIYELA